MGEAPAHLVELVRRRTLEREDRLLVVADREEAAVAAAAGEAGGELVGEVFKDAPLRLARVLRLVHEDVVDAGVELMQHPARVGAVEQGAGALDEVVEVEHAVQDLAPLVAGEGEVGESEERARALNRFGDPAPLAQHREALLLGHEVGLQVGPLLGESARHQRLRRAARLGEEEGEIGGHGLAAAAGAGRELRLCPHRRVPFGGAGPVGGGAGREKSGDLRPRPRPWAVIQHGAFDRGHGHVRCGTVGAEQGGQAILRIASSRRAHGRAGAHGIADQLVDGGRRHLVGDPRERRAERPGGAVRLGDRVALGPGHQRRLARVVSHLETRGNVGLEGKQVQQPLAEGVDRLDLQAAGRLYGAGEEPAREQQGLGPGIGGARRPHGRAQALVVEVGPGGKRVEDARRHLRRRRLGEGQAEDLRRRRAAQQQADDALRQYVRLAGPGIGRDPDGGVGVARLQLRGVEVRWNGDGHVALSSPASSHSRTRARWS